MDYPIKEGEKWTEEEVRRFKNNFYYFEKAYNSIGGYNLKSTVGDAMLTYIRVYGYDALHTQSENVIKQNLFLEKYFWLFYVGYCSFM